MTCLAVPHSLFQAKAIGKQLILQVFDLTKKHQKDGS